MSYTAQDEERASLALLNGASIIPDGRIAKVVRNAPQQQPAAPDSDGEFPWGKIVAIVAAVGMIALLVIGVLAAMNWAGVL